MKLLFRYFLVGVMMLFALDASAQTTKWQYIHKVKKGETIFGIAKEYNVTIPELIEANPEMKEAGFELKKGNYVFVPFAKNDDQSKQSAQTSQPAQTTQKSQPTTTPSSVSASSLTTVKSNDGVVRVGVMLPLHNDDGDGRRMIEYYRGMLLALNQLKAEGIKTEVNAWNVPIDADIRTTLLKEGVNRLDLIFGPLYSNMVKPLADYCKANNIKMVIPYSITGNDVAENSNIFQVYQSPEELNNKAIGAFLERFPNHHPIFIDCNDVTSDKGVFTSNLRKQLDASKITYNLTNVKTPLADFRKAFSVNKPNVIVLNSARSPQLNAVFSKLDSLQQVSPGIAISMFGYTEWFMYQKYDLSQFYKYNVYIPTTFYYNAAADKTEALEKLYVSTYGEQMDPNGLPRHAIIGYDQTMFFVRGLNKYHAAFIGKADQSTWKPLQTRLDFVRVGNGGYKNRNFQLVHFLPNQTMEAITY